MDWNSLYSAVIGGLIAIIPVLITMENQSKERDKDRQEQRHEAKIQAVENSLGADIKKVMDMISSLIKIMSENRNYDYKNTILKIRKTARAISEDEYRTEVNSEIKLLFNRTQDILTTLNSISGLVYSFDDDISKEYDLLK